MNGRAIRFFRDDELEKARVEAGLSSARVSRARARVVRRHRRKLGLDGREKYVLSGGEIRRRDSDSYLLR